MKVVIDVEDMDEVLDMLCADRVCGVLEEVGVRHSSDCMEAWRDVCMTARVHPFDREAQDHLRVCICTPEGVPLPVYAVVWP